MQPWSLLSSARLAVLLLLTQGMVLSACAATYKIAVNDLSLPPAAITPLSIKMGLYYPPALRTAHNENKFGEDHYDFSIGPGTIAGFDAAAAAMFGEVVPVQQLPGPAAESDAPAGTLEVSSARGAAFLTGILVTYDLVLHDADGAKRAAWSVDGYGHFVRDPTVTTRAAMRAAIASWMAGFSRQADVRAWLEAIGAVPPTAAPTAEESS